MKTQIVVVLLGVCLFCLPALSQQSNLALNLEALEEMSQSTQSTEVSEEARYQLTEIIPYLNLGRQIRYADSSDEDISFVAVAALVKNMKDQSDTDLINSLSDSRPGLRLAVAKILANRNGFAVEQALVKAAFDEDPRIRHAIIKGLGIQDTRIIVVDATLIKLTLDFSGKHTGLKALEALESRPPDFQIDQALRGIISSDQYDQDFRYKATEVLGWRIVKSLEASSQ